MVDERERRQAHGGVVQLDGCEVRARRRPSAGDERRAAQYVKIDAAGLHVRRGDKTQLRSVCR